jgi:hypothetical protein
VHQQDIVFDGAFERQVGGVWDGGAGLEIVPGAQYESRLVFRDDELGDRLEAYAAPVVVVAAPGGDAVEVALVIHLRECHEPLPIQRERVFDQPPDLQLPGGELHVRLLA